MITPGRRSSSPRSAAGRSGVRRAAPATPDRSAGPRRAPRRGERKRGQAEQQRPPHRPECRNKNDPAEGRLTKDPGRAERFKPRFRVGFRRSQGRISWPQTYPRRPCFGRAEGLEPSVGTTQFRRHRLTGKEDARGRVAPKVRAVSGSPETHPLGIYEWGKHQMRTKLKLVLVLASLGALAALAMSSPAVSGEDGRHSPIRRRRTFRTSPGSARRCASSSAWRRRARTASARRRRRLQHRRLVGVQRRSSRATSRRTHRAGRASPAPASRRVVPVTTSSSPRRSRVWRRSSWRRGRLGATSPTTSSSSG